MHNPRQPTNHKTTNQQYRYQPTHHVGPQASRHHYGTANGGGNTTLPQRPQMMQTAHNASLGGSDLQHMADYNSSNMAQQQRTHVFPGQVPPMSNIPNYQPSFRRAPYAPVMIPGAPNVPGLQYYIVQPGPQPSLGPRYPMMYLNSTPSFQPTEQIPYTTPTTHSDQTYVPSTDYSAPVYQPQTESSTHASEQPKTSSRPRRPLTIQNPETLEVINIDSENTSSSSKNDASGGSGKDGKSQTVDARQELYDKVHALTESSTSDSKKQDPPPKLSPGSRAVSNGPVSIEPAVLDPTQGEGMGEATINAGPIHHPTKVSIERASLIGPIIYDSMKPLDVRSEQITPVVSANTNAPAKHIAHKQRNDNKEYSNVKSSSGSTVGNISGSSPARQGNKKAGPQVVESKKIVQQQSTPLAVNSTPSTIPAVETGTASSGPGLSRHIPVSTTSVSSVAAEPAPAASAETTPQTITAQQQAPSRSQDEFKTVVRHKKNHQGSSSVPHNAEVQMSDAEYNPPPPPREKREKNKANSQASSAVKEGQAKTNEKPVNESQSKSQNVPSSNQKSQSNHSAQKQMENASPARQNKKSNASAQSAESKKNAANATQHAPVTANTFSSVLAAPESAQPKAPIEIFPATVKPQMADMEPDDFKMVVGKKSRKIEIQVVKKDPVPEPEVPAPTPAPAPKEKREKNKANMTAAKEAHSSAKNEKSSVPSTNQKSSQPAPKEKLDKEKSEKSEKLDKVEKVEKVEKIEKAEKEKVEKVEKEKPEKVEKPEKPVTENIEKIEKADKAAKSEKVEKVLESEAESPASAVAQPESKPAAAAPEPTPAAAPASAPAPAPPAAAPAPAPAPTPAPAPVMELNPDGQWSPTNPVGKKKYPKDFLLSLADMPQCRIQPNLPMNVRVSVEKVSGGGSGGGPSMYRPKIDELYPFSKGSSQSPRISQHSAYPFPSIRKVPSQNRGMNKSNKIQLSLSLHEDVKLKETENAWKPVKLAKKTNVDMNSEEKKTEDLYNKVRSILNKLTPQKLDTLVNQIKDLPINNPERLGGVVDLIIKKAIDEPNFSEAYAKMCKILSTGQYMNISDKENFDKNQTDFRRVLLNCCQKQFELREKIEADYKEKIKNDMKEVTDPEKVKELKFNHQEEERKIRMKAAGHCRFIGELFKLDMLKTSIMHNCIMYLLKKTDEEPLESLCKLLTTIGKHYESRLENKNQALDPIMDELAKLASKNNKQKKKNAPQISSRIRFMIQDVLDLRANDWVPRRDDNRPKTIDQIHKEAEREQLETSISLANTSMKKLDRPRMDDRKRGGSRDSFMNSDGDSWQTPKNVSRMSSSYKGSSYPIDTSKFENFKMSIEQPMENIRLGMARPNIWASGAVTNKGNQPDQSRNKIPERNQFAALLEQDRDNNQFFNNSNKSSSISRDKSRDSRNMSQDDDMLPKSRPMGGPPSREGSHMRSAPPSIQPPVAPVKPVLEPEAMTKLIKSTLDEYISLKQISEVELTLKAKFVTPACIEKFVDGFLEYFLEKRKDQDVVAPVLGLLLDSKLITLTPQIIAKQFSDFLSLAEDLIIDYPKFWEYMALVMGHTLTSEHFNFDHVRQSCKSILQSDNSKKLLALIFNVISSIKTAIWISHKWNASKVSLKDFIPENDVDEFIKTNKLEYLTDPNAPILKSSTPTFTFDEIKTKLLQILQDHPDDALVPVQSWVSENWGPGPYDHSLIRPLMTAICEASITGAGEKNVFNKEVLEKHSKLISYYVDYNPNLEAHCLMAICELMEKLQHPKGLALHFFQHLLEHTMSIEGFKRFHAGSEMDPPENSEQNRIRGIVVLGTRSFWTAAFENLENSDDEGTS